MPQWVWHPANKQLNRCALDVLYSYVSRSLFFWCKLSNKRRTITAVPADDVIMAARQKPETEVDGVSKGHVTRVSRWRPSLYHHLLSTLLLMLILMTPQSLALSGEWRVSLHSFVLVFVCTSPLPISAVVVWIIRFLCAVICTTVVHNDKHTDVSSS